MQSRDDWFYATYLLGETILLPRAVKTATYSLDPLPIMVAISRPPDFMSFS